MFMILFVRPELQLNLMWIITTKNVSIRHLVTEHRMKQRLGMTDSLELKCVLFLRCHYVSSSFVDSVWGFWRVGMMWSRK